MVLNKIERKTMLQSSNHQLPVPFKIIGFWFNEKKSQKFGANELSEACRKKNMDFVKINLEEDLEKNVKYDVILHKFTALYSPTFSGDLKAQALVRKIEKYVHNNPRVFVIDPLESIQKLLLRTETYLHLASLTKKESQIFTPNFITLSKENIGENIETLLNEKRVIFPVVCKPLLAGGAKDAHDMFVVFNEEQLMRCALPCVVQSFINHDAVLYKVFVIGSKWFVTTRPSLKNFKAGDFEMISFNSHHISKSDSCSELTLLEEKRYPRADLSVIKRIVWLVKTSLQSELLGIDVVLDKDSGCYAIIDVNPFPSFESVPDLMDHVADAIRSKIDSKNIEEYRPKYYPTINLNQEYFLQDISVPASDFFSRKERFTFP